MMNLTDAQQAFADSAEGRAAIAKARRTHDLGQAHKGRNALPWTDAMQADAIRRLAVDAARSALHRAEMAITSPRQIAAAQAARDTALMLRNQRISNAYRGSHS